MTIKPATTPSDAYWRRLQVDAVRGVHDGDTFWALIDLGFDENARKPVRCYHANAPELGTIANPNPDGAAARAWTVDWLIEHADHLSGTLTSEWPLWVRFMSWDKYAPRFDGIVECGQGHCWNDDLLASGHAVPMPSLHNGFILPPA